MLNTLLSFLGLGSNLFTTINNITAAISNLQIAKVNAKTEQDKAVIQGQIDALNIQSAVLQSDNKSPLGWLDILVRTSIGASVALYISKIFVWDKVLGYGSTDPLDDKMWWVLMVSVGFYFVHSILKGR